MHIPLIILGHPDPDPDPGYLKKQGPELYPNRQHCLEPTNKNNPFFSSEKLTFSHVTLGWGQPIYGQNRSCRLPNRAPEQQNIYCNRSRKK